MTGQLSTTAGGALTVKILVQVTGASQLLVAVKTTVAVPPHLSGAPVLLLVKTVPQPPVATALANQILNLELMVDCV